MWSLVLAALAASAASQTVTTIQGDPARFKYTYMKTPLSGPCDVSEGPNGLIYVQELLANKIVKYNQHTDELTEYDIPFTEPVLGQNISIPLPGNLKAAFASCAIRNGFDGLMYFSNGDRNQLVQHNVHTSETKVFTPPGLLQALGNLQPLNDLTTAPDGVYMSMTTGNQLAKFEYKTHKWTYFDVPTPLATPLGMYYARDGAIWFLEFTGQKVGRLDRKTGTITEYPLPLTASGPVVMRAETRDHNGDDLLWFACVLGGGIASINQRTKAIQFHSEQYPSAAVEVAQDWAGNVWVTHILENKLGVYNPTHDNFTEIVLPGSLVAAPVGVPPYVGSGIYGKPVGNPFTGNGTGDFMWFTELTANRLVRYDLRGLVY